MTNLKKSGFRQAFKGQLQTSKEHPWIEGLTKPGEFVPIKEFIQEALDNVHYVKLYGHIREERFLVHILSGGPMGRIGGDIIRAGLKAGLELREVGTTTVERSTEPVAFVTFRLGY